MMPDRVPLPRALWAVAAGFAVLAIALTYPQARYLTSHVATNYDSLFNIWRLSWVAHQLPRDPLHLFDANIFFPQRATLAYSDAMLLPGVAVAPLAWLGMAPITVYNLVLLAAFVCNATAAAILGWRLTGRVEAGLIAGLIFGFAPHRFDHFHHLELQLNWWMPLAFLALQDAVVTARSRSYATLALLITLQVLSCIYHGLFLLICLAGAAMTLVVTRQATQLWKHLSGIGWLSLAAVVLFSYSIPYWANRAVVGERPLWEIVNYSAVPVNFLAAPPENALYGALTSRFGEPERFLFPGVIAAALATIGVFSRRRALVAAWIVTLALSTDLALGMNGLLYPFLYEHLDLFRGLRVPARAGILILLSLAALAALGLELILSKISRRAVRMALTTVLFIVMIVEYQTRVSLAKMDEPESVYRLLRKHPAPVILELPVSPPEGLSAYPDAFYMYRSITHWGKLINGYSGFYPTTYIRTLQSLESFPDPDSVAFLERMGATHVILHRQGWFGRLEYDATIDRLQELGVPLILNQSGLAMFTLPRKPRLVGGPARPRPRCYDYPQWNCVATS